MTKLYILIGVPGSGKSTWSKNRKEKVFSSDDYRLKMFGELTQENNNLVFEQLYKDMFDCLAKGLDVVYDATNITRKNRIHLYNLVSKLNVHVVAVHFLVPLETAIERNNKRYGKAVVPNEIIERMFKHLQVAKINVDCDSIQVVGEMVPKWYQFDVPHNNPYHSETIKEHIQRVIDLAKTEKEKIVAQWHDSGKLDSLIENKKDTPQAKFFRDKNNGKFWQYLQHPNISAQYYLSHIQDNLTEENLDNLEHILLHDTELGEKIINRYKLDDNFITFHNRFKEIDKGGSTPSIYLEQYLEIMRNK